jgi:hypothetical protein
MDKDIEKALIYLLIYNKHAQKVPFGDGMLYLCVEKADLG